jgi:hypothetical protein
VFTTNMYWEESFPTSTPALVIMSCHFRFVCMKKKPVVSKAYMSSSTRTSSVRYFGEKKLYWRLFLTFNVIMILI